jgi:biopolymer transport protein ExbD
VIAASRAASHGAVIGAIDALRSVGITKIAFAVERKK